MSIRKAFSLTELLIVLVILAVLFTASLPVVTKRKVTDYINDSVWNYVYADEQKDAYYHPGDDVGKTRPAVAFVGLAGDREKHGKLTIRAGLKTKIGGEKSNKPEEVQRHIQFRYGPERGLLVGTLHVDDYNMLLGGTYEDLLSPDYITNYSKASNNTEKYFNKYNTMMGIRTGNNFRYLGRSVLIGNSSLANINQDSITTNDEGNALAGIIAIGNNVYSRATVIAPNNLFIGHNTGGIDFGYQDEINFKYNENNTVVGYNALPFREEFSSTDANGHHKTSYQNNVFLGAFTGGYFRPKDSELPNPRPNEQNISRNVIIGSEYKSNDASDNVIIGHGAYENGDPDINYLTAIGNNACNSVRRVNYEGTPVYVENAKFPRTCIGVDSAADIGEYGVDELDSDGNATTSRNIIARNDEVGKYVGAYPEGDERIYIGAPSRNLYPGKYNPAIFRPFAGRSLLEIHNVPEPGNNYGWETNFASKPTVIFNSNLVVRGLTYVDVYNESWGKDDSVYYNRISPSIFLTTPRSERMFTVVDEEKCKFQTDGTSGKFWCGTELGPLPYSLSSNVRIFSKVTSPMYGEDTFAGPYTSFDGSSNNRYRPNLSDIRLKTDITENNDGLDKLKELKLYNYTFKADPFGKPQVGVIAQELQEVFPNSVSKDKDGFLKIRWDEMFYAMINSIKELAAKLEKIAVSISDMEVSTITIKNQHKELRKEIAQLNARAARLERK